MTTTPLRDLVTDRLNVRWERFAADHPHLAAAVDRTRLVDAGVERLRSDPRFLAAMREADVDEAQLAAAARAMERVEQVLMLVLPR